MTATTRIIFARTAITNHNKNRLVNSNVAFLLSRRGCMIPSQPQQAATTTALKSCYSFNSYLLRTMSTSAHRIEMPTWIPPTSSSSSNPAATATKRGRPAEDWRQSQKQSSSRWQQQEDTTTIPRLKPQKYKSLVYLPNTVSLQYPNKNNNNNNKNKKFTLNCVDFAISKPGKGGHVLLGKNGSGKSLLVEFLTNTNNNNANMVVSSSDLLNVIDDDTDWKLLDPSNNDVAYVSFESHLQILKEQPYLTVHDAITGGDGNLSKAAQYLVVRFGLKPLLHRTVSTLSTGEIRKCLLVSALSKEPYLLVLENPFDGLDVSSRNELKSIVSKTIKGLGNSAKLLVTHVNAEHVPPAQVFMSTHRPEEIVPEISTVSVIQQQQQQQQRDDDDDNDNNNNTLVTIQRPPGWSAEQLMYMALGLDKDHNKNKNWATLAPWQVEDDSLPSAQELQDVWSWRDEKANISSSLTSGEGSSPQTDDDDVALMSLDQVSIRRRQDGMTTTTPRRQQQNDGNDDMEKNDDEFATLLQPLSWEIKPGQRWLIAGGNGAGKSTLSRFLLQMENHKSDDGEIQAKNHQLHALDDANKDTTCDLISGNYSTQLGTTIGWVSTESHLGRVVVPITQANWNHEEENTNNSHPKSAWDVISHDKTVPQSIVRQVVSWVFGNDDTHESLLQSTALEELSQGQQKLALIASAVALRPKVLIMDEPTQGLDWMNRCRVLSLLERLCQATDTSLIYITHYQEEWIPSISHVLHLNKGHVVYQGPKTEYDPDRLD